MRIHGLCLVKNEGDIICQGLSAARHWCDAIYVLDNGSEDDTWQKVQLMAEDDPGIIAWRQWDVPFRDGLRADIYHAFSNRAKAGDWWARLDPDEFYVDDPRRFLAAVPQKDGCVWQATLTYYFSTEEAQRYESEPESFDDDIPIHEKCRHYFNHWSEMRFVRHEEMEPWDGREGWPEGLMRRVRSHRHRILCQHFQYRSPAQIERRIATRRAAALRGGGFDHELLKDWRRTVDPRSIREHKWDWASLEYVSDPMVEELGWRSRVVDAASLEYDAHDGFFRLNNELMPPLPGSWEERVRSIRRLPGRVSEAFRRASLARQP